MMIFMLYFYIITFSIICIFTSSTIDATIAAGGERFFQIHYARPDAHEGSHLEKFPVDVAECRVT